MKYDNNVWISNYVPCCITNQMIYDCSTNPALDHNIFCQFMNWKTYNHSLVRRGEIIMSFDVMDHWKTELDEIKKGKDGRQYKYPKSFTILLEYARVYFGLPYRQTQVLVQAYRSKRIPKVPNHISINRRINKLDIKVNPNIGKEVVFAIDSFCVPCKNKLWAELLATLFQYGHECVSISNLTDAPYLCYNT